MTGVRSGSPRPDPRFDDAQVEEILRIATRIGPDGGGDADAWPGGRPTGLALSELRAIAAEAGISPARVEAAARELLAREAEPPGVTLLGAPRSVARIVPLDRPLEDAGWNRLVAHLRGTFGAQGKVVADGEIRSWRNGNLQVHIEPDPAGIAPWRIRMQTLQGSSGGLAGLGFAGVGMGVLSIALGVVGGMDPKAFVVGAGFLTAGGGQLAWLRARLNRWAAERRAQMEAIAGGVAKFAAEVGTGTDPGRLSR